MTVEQLIEKLKTFPPQARAVLRDADTEWTITKIHFFLGDYPTGPEVSLGGEYGEMHSTDAYRLTPPESDAQPGA